MRAWIKYLIIGWSIVSLGIVIVSFQLMKAHYIEEGYEIMMVHKPTRMQLDKIPGEPDKFIEGTIAESLFNDPNPYRNMSITKEEFVERMKKAKGVTIESKRMVKDKSIYLFFPLYSFIIWGLPILIFSLVGTIFGREKRTQMKEEPGK